MLFSCIMLFLFLFVHGGREGVPLPTRVTINADRSYNLVIHHPTATYFLKQVH